MGHEDKRELWKGIIRKCPAMNPVANGEVETDKLELSRYANLEDAAGSSKLKAEVIQEVAKGKV